MDNYHIWTVYALMGGVLCGYEEGNDEASSYIDVEALPLEEDAEKSNSDK